MKKTLTILLLALVLVGLTACQPADTTNTPTPTPEMQESPLNIPTDAPQIEGVPEGHDPASEEDPFTPIADTDFNESGTALFAGATPIPLDPVDMPTPTPRTSLVFTYANYTASKLGLSFESAAGYTVNDSDPNTYVLTEPEEQKKDNVSVVFTFNISTVVNNYNKNNIRTDVRSYATDLGKVNYKEWRLYDTAERTLLNKPGYYVNYRGVMHDGTIVRGRVHMALLDNNRLLTLNFVCPGEYNSDYTGVYTHIRSTLKTL